MTIREKIEAVLRKYEIIPGLKITKFGASSISDDLLSCFPQPSWEELRILLKNRLVAKSAGSIDIYEPFLDELMDWATGNQEQPAKPQPSLKTPEALVEAWGEALKPSLSLKTLERIFELHDHKYSSKAEWLKAIQFDILLFANGTWKEPAQTCSTCGQIIKELKETN